MELDAAVHNLLANFKEYATAAALIFGLVFYVLYTREDYTASNWGRRNDRG